MIDIKLAQWATLSEVEAINVVNSKGSFRKAAKHLGVHHTKRDVEASGGASFISMV